MVDYQKNAGLIKNISNFNGSAKFFIFIQDLLNYRKIKALHRPCW